MMQLLANRFAGRFNGRMAVRIAATGLLTLLVIGCHTQEDLPPAKVQPVVGSPAKCMQAAAKTEDRIPTDWNLRSIYAAARKRQEHSWLLAWKIETWEGSSSRLESCVVLTQEEDDQGRDCWMIHELYRHRDAQEPDWIHGEIHFGATEREPYGHLELTFRKFNRVPRNRDIYSFLSHVGWQFGSTRPEMLLDGAVCSTAWQQAVGERPTKFFVKP